MRFLPVILVGLMAWLIGCGNDATYKATHEDAYEKKLIFAIREDQATYNAYLSGRLEKCKEQSMILIRDNDGILVCAKPAEQKGTN